MFTPTPRHAGLFTYFGVAAFFLASSGPAESAPSVDTIVKQANHTSYYQGRDGRAKAAMTITDSQGRTRKRQMTILRRNADPQTDTPDADGEQKMYVYFHRPPDVNKMVFMVWKHMEQDDDRWLYLPALDLVKRIAATDKRTSFVGSDFFYEDVSGRIITKDHHELAETSDVYYVLTSTPKDPNSVEFASYKSWIHKQTFLPVKIEYYNAQGKQYREYQALEVKTIQGFPSVTKSQMRDLRSGGNTVVEYADIQYTNGLPDDIFTERYLRRRPREYMP